MASKRENFHVIWAYLSFCCLVLNQKVNFMKSLLRTSLPAICDPWPATCHPPNATSGKVLPVGGCIRRWFKVTGLGVDCQVRTCKLEKFLALKSVSLVEIWKMSYYPGKFIWCSSELLFVSGHQSCPQCFLCSQNGLKCRWIRDHLDKLFCTLNKLIQEDG